MLIVDDNNRYAEALINYFMKDGWIVERAYNAKEGWNKYLESKSTQNHYGMIITDITMETQTSGLWMIRKIYKDGFSGTKGIATTGMDYSIMVWLAKWFLPSFCGIDFIIPKKPIREKGQVVIIPLKESSL